MGYAFLCTATPTRAQPHTPIPSCALTFPAHTATNVSMGNAKVIEDPHVLLIITAIRVNSVCKVIVANVCAPVPANVMGRLVGMGSVMLIDPLILSHLFFIPFYSFFVEVILHS